MAASLLLPLAAAFALHRAPTITRALALPLLASAILLAIHGWIPLITFGK